MLYTIQFSTLLCCMKVKLILAIPDKVQGYAIGPAIRAAQGKDAIDAVGKKFSGIFFGQRSLIASQ